MQIARKRKSDKFDRIGNIDKDHDSSYGGSQDAMEQDDLGTGQMENLPITAFHPNLGMIELATIIKDNSLNRYGIQLLQ